MNQSSNNRGRTFWDLIAEHPKMTFSLIVILILAVVFLAWNKYSIKTSVLSLEPEKTTTVAQTSTDDTIKNTSKYKLDTTASHKKQITVNPKTKAVKEQLVIKHPYKDTVKTEVVNVTSHNQNGGITANQVNIGAIPRKLDNNIQNQLLGFLQDKNERIEISSILGDPESFEFASQINNFLKSQGYLSVDGVNQSVYTKPVVGQFLNRDSTGVKILIGSKTN